MVCLMNEDTVAEKITMHDDKSVKKSNWERTELKAASKPENTRGLNRHMSLQITVFMYEIINI